MLRFDILGKEIEIFTPGEIIKHVVEHAADVILAIVDDLFQFLVPEHRHSDPLVEIRIGCFISLAQKLKAVDRIG